MHYWIRWIRNLPQHPERVIVLCALSVVFSLLIDGSGYRIWQLSVRQHELKDQISEANQKTQELNEQIEMAHDPKYLEREARERFDLVYKDDLIFVFAE